VGDVVSAPPVETSSIGPLEAFWRFRAWTVPVTIVIGLLAGVFVLATSGTSTASTTLYLTDPRGTPVFRDGSSTPTDLDRYARQRAEFADSAEVHEAVVAAMEGETVDSVDDVVATGTTSSSDVRIDCTADSEERALRICDEVVAAYLELTERDTIARADATVDAFLSERDRLVEEGGGQSTIDQIDLQIAEVRSEAALLGNGVEFVEPAQVDEDSRILPALQYSIAALLFAAFATAIIAWFRAGRRPVVTTSSDATATLDAPLLGEVTEAPPHRFEPTSPPGAAYQLLATSLGAVRPDGGVILAATATPSQHAAETVARLAVAAAREGRSVLVVDSSVSTTPSAGSPSCWQVSRRSTTCVARSVWVARRPSTSWSVAGRSTTPPDSSGPRPPARRCTPCTIDTSSSSSTCHRCSRSPTVPRWPVNPTV
jgi:capsular polysaccharide biosynthesis protein